jgi:hypothetical protein
MAAVVEAVTGVTLPNEAAARELNTLEPAQMRRVVQVAARTAQHRI